MIINSENLEKKVLELWKEMNCPEITNDLCIEIRKQVPLGLMGIKTTLLKNSSK